MLSYFSESGLFASAGVEFVDHSFSQGLSGGSDKFAPVNVSVGYRMWDNRGIISVEVQNLLGENFNFQNRSTRLDLTAAPRYAPEMTVLAHATLNF
jgi:hypothetical protein